MRRVQDGKTGNSCPQAFPTAFLVARPPMKGVKQSEDCLFLDVIIPGHVVRSEDYKNKKLAIVHWIPGGGFGISQIIKDTKVQ